MGHRRLHLQVSEGRRLGGRYDPRYLLRGAAHKLPRTVKPCRQRRLEWKRSGLQATHDTANKISRTALRQPFVPSSPLGATAAAQPHLGCVHLGLPVLGHGAFLDFKLQHAQVMEVVQVINARLVLC